MELINLIFDFYNQLISYKFITRGQNYLNNFGKYIQSQDITKSHLNTIVINEKAKWSQGDSNSCPLQVMKVIK